LKRRRQWEAALSRTDPVSGRLWRATEHGSGSLFRWTLFRRTLKYLILTLTLTLNPDPNTNPNPNPFWAFLICRNSVHRNSVPLPPNTVVYAAYISYQVSFAIVLWKYTNLVIYLHLRVVCVHFISSKHIFYGHVFGAFYCRTLLSCPQYGGTQNGLPKLRTGVQVLNSTKTVK